MRKYAVVDLEDQQGDQTGLTLEEAIATAMRRSGCTWNIRREGRTMRLFVNSLVRQQVRGLPSIASDNRDDREARVEILTEIVGGTFPFSGALTIMPMPRYRREMARA